MISRRDDEAVPSAAQRGGVPTEGRGSSIPQNRDNKEINHFLASLRAGEFGSSSSLLVVRVALWLHFAPRVWNMTRIRSAKPIWLEFHTLGKLA